MNTPVNDSTSDANRLTAQAPSLSHTYMGDWTWMSDIPDNALRIYQCVRAFIFDKDPDSVTVRLTDQEIAQLTRRSESTAKRGRKTCYEHGLLWEVSRSVEQRPPSKPGGRPRVRTVRTLGIALEPPEGFSGPTNCYTELRRIRREAQQESEGSDLTGHTDQAKQKVSDVSAGQCEGSNLVEGRSNLIDPRPDLLGIASSDQQEAPPQVPSQVPSPTNTRAEAREDGWLAGDETDANNDRRAAAHALLHELRMPVGERYKPDRAAIDTVLRAWDAGMKNSAITNVLTHDLHNARSSARVLRTYRLPDLEAEIVERTRSERPSANPEPEESPWPEWCGHCDEVNRRYEDAHGKWAKCPRCHPHPKPSAPAQRQQQESADERLIGQLLA